VTLDRSASLILVRHGRAVADPGLPASLWPLQEPDACRALGRLLPDRPITTSPEAKAVGTARAIGREFSIDDRLREVARPWTPAPSDFDAQVAAYLRGTSIEGWEPQSDALRRFAAAADGIVISHGTVMSLYLGSVADADPVEFWQTLEMPDAWQLTVTGNLVRLGNPLPL
jgi:broad specificity phosphatase PhoE